MTDAALTTRPKPTFRRALSTRGCWAVLAMVVVGLLSYGSIHPPTKTATQRINTLESVIKCPPCADISIAQSDDQQAITLRRSVVQWVNEGWSDTRIENTVVSLYGANELLKPKTTGIDIAVWLIPLLGIAIGIGGVGYVLLQRRKPTDRSDGSDDDEQLVARARQGASQ